MKILYISCHIVLEYDELRILNDLGHSTFSLGGYIIPTHPQSETRPPLKIKHDMDMMEKYHKMRKSLAICDKDIEKKLTNEFLNNFDCIIIMHDVEWIDRNLDTFRNRLVILRTIGQNIWNNELKLAKYKTFGIKILRYSPKESSIPNYAGGDGIIRFLKYESDFKLRNRSYKNIISFGQNVKGRGNNCGYSYMESIAKNINFKLYGPGNNDVSFNGGKLSYTDQINALATNSAYFHTGTYPAQYVLNFIEALMAGIPMVSIGRKLANEMIVPFEFEVPDILDKENLLYFDDVNEIINSLKKLIDNSSYNTEISNKQLKIAHELFSFEKNGHQWKEFLNKL